jgi:hypothetical protein
MSELIQNNNKRTMMRWRLLTSASALALTTCVVCAAPVRADESNRPQVWIELGGQLSRLQDRQETFSPPLMTARPPMFSPSQNFEGPPPFSIDEEGAISFQPKDSKWTFSASVRYGRSTSNHNKHEQTSPDRFHLYFNYFGSPINFTQYPVAAKFADTKSRINEDHLVLDFQVGRDVGLGLFGGKSGTSQVSLGVRFAQFTGKTNISLKSDPDWHFVYRYYPTLITYFGATSSKNAVGQAYHSNRAVFAAQRSFHGVGPSLSWNASIPVVSTAEDSELTFDWGINAAVLFGRQKERMHHQTTGLYQPGAQLQPPIQVVYQPPPVDAMRSKSVTVPNIGGFAGVSFKYDVVKVSFGYRADFFFGAMDGGIDQPHTEDIGFHGPFATVSIGLAG